MYIHEICWICCKYLTLTWRERGMNKDVHIFYTYSIYTKNQEWIITVNVDIDALYLS